MQEKELKWRKVTGPMTATMKALLDNGWKIVKPDKWVRVIGNDEKELAKITENPHETRAVLRAFGQDVEFEIWRKAAKHYLGRGLENGPPSMEAARRAKKTLVKEGRYREAASLDKVVCGANWFQDRMNGEMKKQKCHRCGQENIAWHAYCACPELKSHPKDEVYMYIGPHIR